MWTPATRRQHSRDHLRYETDLTDAEWALIEPLLPAPSRRRRPCTCLREVLDAIFFVLRGRVTSWPAPPPRIGMASPVWLPRGLNDLWTRGGLMYALPLR